MRDAFCAALGLGGIISTAKYSYDHSSLAKPAFDEISLISAMIREDDHKLSCEENKARMEVLEQDYKQRYLRSEEDRISNC